LWMESQVKAMLNRELLRGSSGSQVVEAHRSGAPGNCQRGRIRAEVEGAEAADVAKGHGCRLRAGQVPDLQAAVARDARKKSAIVTEPVGADRAEARQAMDLAAVAGAADAGGSY